MLPLIFQKRLFLYLFIGFILAVVVGTMSHECGHWLAARYYGFKDQTIGYNYTHYGTPSSNWLRRDSILSRYISEINTGARTTGDKEYTKLQKAKKVDIFLIAAGGPIQTMLAGTFGLILLLIYRKKFAGIDSLSVPQWSMVFLALFWLREIFDLAAAVIYFWSGHTKVGSDEFKMANILHWNQWSIFAATSVISLLVLFVVAFRFVPSKQRLTFIIAGFTGGLTGAYLWLVLLGPKLMP